uniref:VPS37 C-terminal domain-containing protein n=1 Tax=Knipowitschia caucasica TaxID=637954 RepID=A0AAV2J610_KNICA
MSHSYMTLVCVQFQELQQDRESLLTSNRSLAEVSLLQRPRLHTGRGRLHHKYQEMSNLATSCCDKQSKLEARGHRGSVQGARLLLQEEVAHAEEQSEELLQTFMEGHLSLDVFLDSFQQQRRIYHVRRAQAEKLQELSDTSQTAPNASSKPHSPTDLPDPAPAQDSDPPRPNGFLPQGPLRVFQVRYGLTPAILVPHCPLSPSANGSCGLPPPNPPSAAGAGAVQGSAVQGPSVQGPPMGLRLIGQLPGGWASGRPVRVQQLYRPNPAHTEPPCR